MIDLRQCKPGDELIRRDGKIVEYYKHHGLEVKVLAERYESGEL